MPPLSALWLPILLSAVIVFVASSVMHTALPYHRNDYKKLPDEDKVLPALRAAGLQRGLYVFPFCTHKEMKTPEAIEKYKQGPVGMMTVFPSGPPFIPKFLGLWFGYCLVISFFVAYLTCAHGADRHGLSGGLSRRWNSCVSRVRSGTASQCHLERYAVGLRNLGSDRWIGLRAADRRHVRLALAALSKKISKQSAHGFTE